MKELIEQLKLKGYEIIDNRRLGLTFRIEAQPKRKLCALSYSIRHDFLITQSGNYLHATEALQHAKDLTELAEIVTLLNDAIKNESL